MSNSIYTFGYEGLSISAFVSRLVALNVKIIIDVRANPLSRKPGFSKSALTNALNENGISYIHFKALGCPKPIRDRYKNDDDWQSYTTAFLSYLAENFDEVGAVSKIARQAKSCLICFEADFNRCHRTYVGREVARTSGLQLIHITGQTTIPEQVVRFAA